MGQREQMHNAAVRVIEICANAFGATPEQYAVMRAKRELKAAEIALGTDPTPANLARLRRMQRIISRPLK